MFIGPLNCHFICIPPARCKVIDFQNSKSPVSLLEHSRQCIHFLAGSIQDLSPAAALKEKKRDLTRRENGDARAAEEELPGDGAVAREQQERDDDEMDVFGSNSSERKKRKEDKDARFEDRAPVVHTRDPFEEANVIRKAHRIRVAGLAPPMPLRGFNGLQENFDAPRRLMDNLLTEGFGEPTPIQRQAIPVLLKRREVLAVAPTGSGKTLAFLIPIIMHVHSIRKNSLPEKKGDQDGNDDPERGGIAATVVSPTKELSTQTGRVLVPLLPGLKLRASVLSKATASGTDFSKVDILLANPLRLGAMAREGSIDLSHVQTLILDEADKLFDMGFAEQIDEVIFACSNPNIIRGLFSATLPETVETLARSVLRDPLRITVGERNTAASAVRQRLLFVGRETGKLLAMRQLISEGLNPPVLVFVNSKDRAKELHRELMYDGVHVDSLHANQSHAARLAAVDNFRLGKTWVLICTDLVGRGMDFAGVNTVINYDFPTSTVDYIHRIGRTGRAGREGEAITFFTESDVIYLRGVANVMRAAGCDVPEWMLRLKKEKRRGKRKNVDRPNAKGGEGITADPVMLEKKKIESKSKRKSAFEKCIE